MNTLPQHPLKALLSTTTVACLLCTASLPASAQTPAYQQTNLVADQPGAAWYTDAKLKNPWGIAFHPNGAVWLANNQTGTSTLYDGNGIAIYTMAAVAIPSASGTGAAVLHRHRLQFQQ